MLTPYCGALNNTACEECCLLLHNTQSSAALTTPPSRAWSMPPKAAWPNRQLLCLSSADHNTNRCSGVRAYTSRESVLDQHTLQINPCSPTKTLCWLLSLKAAVVFGSADAGKPSR